MLGIAVVEGRALGTCNDAEQQEGSEEEEHRHISDYLATDF